MTDPTLDALRALVAKWREVATSPKRDPNYRNGVGDCATDLEAVLSAALASASAGHARYTVNPPYRVRVGKPPIPTTHPCLYTQAQPCKELFTDPDEWCGYCAGHAEAVPLAAAPPRAPETPAVEPDPSRPGPTT